MPMRSVLLRAPRPDMIFVLALPFVVLALYIFRQWERIRALQKECDALGKACAEQAEKIEKLETENSASSKKATDVSNLSKTREKALNTKIAEWTHRHTKLQNEHDQLQAKYARELRAAQDELQALRERRDELQKLVEAQAVELTAAREFTFMTDQVAAADVIRMVQDLNSTIYQTAMQLISIEPPASSAKTAPPSPAKLAEARNNSVTAIGERLLHLAGQDDESFHILAFQSAISHVCASAISSWVFGRGLEPQNELLNFTYGHIWGSEKQAVAGRWRALTHKQLSNVGGNHIQSEIHELLLCILVSVGWRAGLAEMADMLHDELGDHIDEIASFVGKTSKMIREEFISEDLQVSFVPPGQQFNLETMEAEEGQAMPNIQAPVLGTVELGLALRNRSGGQRILLKPRVALDTHPNA